MDMKQADIIQTAGMAAALLYPHLAGQKTLSQLAMTTGLSVMTVRRAIARLREAGMIQVTRTGRASVFQSVHCEQSECSHVNNQSVHCVLPAHTTPPSSPPSLFPSDSLSLSPPIIPPNKVKNRDIFIPPTSEEVERYITQEIPSHLRGSLRDAEAFMDYWRNRDWRFNGGRGARMRDWRLAACSWMRNAARWRSREDRRNMGLDDLMRELDGWFGGRR